MPFLDTGAARLFIMAQGPAGAPAILFSNSLGTTHRMWDKVVDELAAEFLCIRYDTRGHGASDGPEGPFEIADLADDAAAILDHFGLDSCHFAGLSLGGMTGQSFAVRHPDRLRSLTLMATSAFMPTREAWESRAALVRREGTRAIVEATLERWFTQGFRREAPAVAQSVADIFCGVDAGGYAAACEAIARMDLRPLLPAIAARTLIVAGREDPATPLPMAEELAAGIPDARLCILSPAAHLLAVERPAETADLLRGFVSRQGRSG